MSFSVSALSSAHRKVAFQGNSQSRQNQLKSIYQDWLRPPIDMLQRGESFELAVNAMEDRLQDFEKTMKGYITPAGLFEREIAKGYFLLALGSLLFPHQTDVDAQITHQRALELDPYPARYNHLAMLLGHLQQSMDTSGKITAFSHQQLIAAHPLKQLEKTFLQKAMNIEEELKTAPSEMSLEEARGIVQEELQFFVKQKNTAIEVLGGAGLSSLLKASQLLARKNFSLENVIEGCRKITVLKDFDEVLGNAAKMNGNIYALAPYRKYFSGSNIEPLLLLKQQGYYLERLLSLSNQLEESQLSLQKVLHSCQMVADPLFLNGEKMKANEVLKKQSGLAKQGASYYGILTLMGLLRGRSYVESSDLTRLSLTQTISRARELEPHDLRWWFLEQVVTSEGFEQMPLS